MEDITRGRSVYCPSYVAHCTLAYRRKPRTRWNDTALLLWLLYLQQRLLQSQTYSWSQSRLHSCLRHSNHMVLRLVLS